MAEMKNPAASSEYRSKRLRRDCRVGGGAKRRYPPRRTMGIA